MDKRELVVTSLVQTLTGVMQKPELVVTSLVQTLQGPTTFHQ